MTIKTNTPAPSKACLPPKPVFTYQGAQETSTFAAGALALRKALISFEVPPSIDVDDCGSHREAEATEWLAERLECVLKGDGDFRRGAIVALAHFMVRWYSLDSVPGIDWMPLAQPPQHRACDGRDAWLLPENSRLFDVAGIPVSVGEQLIAYRWDDRSGPVEFSLDVVRLLGREISLSDFSAMCEAVLAA